MIARMIGDSENYFSISVIFLQYIGLIIDKKILKSYIITSNGNFEDFRRLDTVNFKNIILDTITWYET
ncbi:hypothetical protein [Sporomusa acidovorans]|uniref:Uncharacterized protein n=1 Tax=Sporomusa acidovorans (strain ATCC 49682 / DSM 3132 / Mol) TaxID=1123286 RepID=A0ABZ3IY07_SPOA4|nr:hypothetical protein [Sporomusa acidovorans]OZC22168.1 hypothetical protein SPACI_15190 [Sporomusa acidovorans DSM 3132]SDE82272.1 hypothetical protein SAMN04488499_102275 [Sporomusa acidovorans]